MKRLGLAAGALAFDVANKLAGDKPSAKALLSHRFLFDEEPRDVTLDGLRRKLEWLASKYVPASVAQLVVDYDARNIRDNTILYTTDDIDHDVFAVREEFQQFGIPLVVFAPVGWIATNDFSETGALVELVTLIQWYEGKDESLKFGTNETIFLSDGTRAGNIDWILENRERLASNFDELCVKIAALEGSHRQRHPHPRGCNWSELQELAANGVEIGSHSVSHIAIKAASPLRRQFELRESKRILTERLGSCDSFAYPFGTWGTYDDSTREDVRNAGYSAGFLTNSDVITVATERFDIPRIFIPDSPVSIADFKHRVDGAGIVHQRLKRFAARSFARSR